MYIRVFHVSFQHLQILQVFRFFKRIGVNVFDVIALQVPETWNPLFQDDNGEQSERE